MAIIYPWNTIADTQTDANSPVNETLMDGIRQNLYHLEEWLGKDYTADANHNHDGVNSAPLASGLVGQTQLKTLTSSIYTAWNYDTVTTQVQSSSFSLGALTYAFLPYPHTLGMTRTNGGSRTATGYGTVECYSQSSDLVCGDLGSVSLSMVPQFRMGSSVTATGGQVTGTISISGYVRYVTATPPHKLGQIENWGEFYFIVRDSKTKEVYMAYTSEDPHWFNYDPDTYEKDDPALPELFPHPFTDYAPYTNIRAEDEGKEIVLIDMRELEEEVDIPLSEEEKSLPTTREKVHPKAQTKLQLGRKFKGREKFLLHLNQNNQLEITGTDEELSEEEKAMLPQGPRFSQHVKVVRPVNGLLAGLITYEVKAKGKVKPRIK